MPAPESDVPGCVPVGWAAAWRGPLARSVAKVLTGNVLGNGLSFLAGVVLARTLDVAAFGVLMALAAPMTLMAQLSDFGLNTAIVKHYREWTERGRTEDAEALLRRAMGWRLAIVVVVATASAAAARPLCTRVLDIPEATTLFRAACLGAVVAAAWSFCQASMQARLQFGRYAALTTANHALRLVLVAALAAAGWLTLPAAVAVMVFAPLLGVLVAAAAWPRAFWTARMDRARLRAAMGSVLRFSRWIFLSAVLTTIIMRLDVLMLAALSDRREVAYYANADNFAQAVHLAGYALATVLLPRLAAARRREELLRVRRAALAAAPVLVLAAGLGVPAGHWLIPRLLGEAWRPSAPVFDVLLAGYLLSIPLLPLSFCCYGLDRAHWLTGMNAAQLALNVLLNAWWIPRWGAMGAAAASVSIRVFALVFLAVAFARLLRLADAAESSPPTPDAPRAWPFDP